MCAEGGKSIAPPAGSNEAALARARIPAGLRMSVLADVAQLMEGNTLGSGDRASKLRRLLLTWHEGQHISSFVVVPKMDLQRRISTPGVTVSNDLVCCGEVLFVTYCLVL